MSQASGAECVDACRSVQRCCSSCSFGVRLSAAVAALSGGAAVAALLEWGSWRDACKQGVAASVWAAIVQTRAEVREGGGGETRARGWP